MQRKWGEEMETKEAAEIVCILDRSGSMFERMDDIIESYNKMLEMLGKEAGETYITTALFSDRCEIVYSHLSIKSVQKLDETLYYVGGNTALFDAIGQVFTQVKKKGNVLAFILTDGMENASRKYNGKEIEKLIREKQKQGWLILFFGTEIDVIKMAEKVGINPRNITQYTHDKHGIIQSYETVSRRFHEMRCNGRKTNFPNPDL